MKFTYVVEGVVDEELADIVFPKSERKPAGSPVLVGEIQAVVVVADVFGAIPVVNAFIIRLLPFTVNPPAWL